MLFKSLAFFIFVNLAFTRYFIIGPAQIRVISVEPCSNYTNLPAQLEVKPYMFNNTVQLLDVFMSIPMDVNENVTLYLKASRVDKHKTQVNSFVINDAPACPTLTKYVGDLWFDIEKQVGVEPGVCPIKMGNYSVHHLLLDLTKIKVQMLLEGQFKARAILKNATKPIYCGDFTVVLFPKEE